MHQIINQEVSVVAYYSIRKQLFLPHTLNWRGYRYTIGKIGYHHKFYNGKIAHHIFELVDKDATIWFRLNFNTDNLHWTLEAISDGNAD